MRNRERWDKDMEIQWAGVWGWRWSLDQIIPGLNIWIRVEFFPFRLSPTFLGPYSRWSHLSVSILYSHQTSDSVKFMSFFYNLPFRLVNKIDKSVDLKKDRWRLKKNNFLWRLVKTEKSGIFFFQKAGMNEKD